MKKIILLLLGLLVLLLIGCGERGFETPYTKGWNDAIKTCSTSDINNCPAGSYMELNNGVCNCIFEGKKFNC